MRQSGLELVSTGIEIVAFQLDSGRHVFVLKLIYKTII